MNTFHTEHLNSGCLFLTVIKALQSFPMYFFSLNFDFHWHIFWSSFCYDFDPNFYSNFPNKNTLYFYPYFQFPKKWWKLSKKMNFLKIIWQFSNVIFFAKKTNPNLLCLNRKKLFQELIVHKKVVFSRVNHGRAWISSYEGKPIATASQNIVRKFLVIYTTS